MKRNSRRRAAAIRALACAEPLEPRLMLSSYSFNLLASLGNNAYLHPGVSLIDSNGNLFGTIGGEGTDKYGEIYELAHGSGTITPLVALNSTTGAAGGLVMDSSGNIFGLLSKEGGSDGAIFELPAGGDSLNILALFNSTTDKESGGLVLDSNGNLYGSTVHGLGDSSNGIIFELVAGNSTITTLASFGTAPGIPYLVRDSSGDLLGTSISGGTNGDGYIFELPQGSSIISTLASFNAASPTDLLTVDPNGNLFGTTDSGGANGHGSIFELSAGGSTITTVASFTAADAGPYSGLTVDSSGNLYGTVTGGDFGLGEIYELSAGSSTITALVSFNGADGGQPGGVILDSSGDIFGGTENGGNGDGSIFEIAAGSTTITTLAAINSTANPPEGQFITAQVMDSNGNFFGGTDGGGDGFGVIFEVAAGSSTASTLAVFNGSNGTELGYLILDSSGNLFGSMGEGGTNNDGAIIELPQGSNTVITVATFNGVNGSGPYGLALDSSGNIYGAADAGGPNGDGTIFEIVKGGNTITNLASFNGVDGNSPYGVLFDTAGNIYGTTYSGGPDNDGVVFELAAGSGTITTLASFNGANGTSPDAGVTMDSSGNLYGTTVQVEGNNSKPATIFELPAGSGTITTLATFAVVSGELGMYPSGLVLDSAGDLFGGDDEAGTKHDGTIYELAAGSGTITTLHTFNGTDGSAPYMGVFLDSSGNLFGAADAGGTSDDGAVFELSPITQLAFAQQPAGGPAGTQGQVVVDIEDVNGNLAASDDSNVTLSLASGLGSLGGTITVAAINGVATFTGLSITLAGTYQLSAADSADGVAGFTSDSFMVTPAAPAVLVFSQQPTNALAGVNISPAITVFVEDAFGNLVTGDSSTVTLAIHTGPAGGTLGGTAQIAANAGVATFAGIFLDKAGGYSLAAADTGLAGTTSASFTISANIPATVQWSSQPANATAGTAQPSLIVSVVDAYGNFAIGTNVTLAVASGPDDGAIIGQTMANVSAGGLATFSEDIFDIAGNYTLSATDGPASANSDGFTVRHASATGLAFAQPPTNSVAGAMVSPIVVNVVDAFGNVCTGNGSTISLTLKSGPTGVAPGTLFSKSATAGAANFKHVMFTAAGDYTLKAKDSALTGVSGNLTVSPAAAAKLKFAALPAIAAKNQTIVPPIVVKVKDAFGNLVTMDNSSITVTILTGKPGAILGGTATEAVVDGKATFSDLMLSKTGAFTLEAADGDLPDAVSGTITVN